MCVIEKGRWRSRKITIICGVCMNWNTYNASCKKFSRKYDIYLKLQDVRMFKGNTYEIYPRVFKKCLRS